MNFRTSLNLYHTLEIMRGKCAIEQSDAWLDSLQRKRLTFEIIISLDIQGT